MSISVLILTLNEERNLRRCLESVRWSDDIVVFDSFSSDRTLEIAREFGARVLQRGFDNERDHRSASLAVGFKHPWVYNPDADEVATPELIDEMREAVRNPGDTVAYRLRFKVMFMGKWIRHSSLYPTWIVRLFRPEALSFERSVNLRMVVHGPESRLNGHLLHYSFNKGIEDWFAKHNRYSSFEAQETLASIESEAFKASELFSRDPILRRCALKELSFRLPARPMFRFFYMYILRRGFMDGLAGYHYCRMLAAYELMISMKAMELRRRSKLLPV